MAPSPQHHGRRQSLGAEMPSSKSSPKPTAQKRDMKKELEKWQAEKEAKKANKENKEQGPKPRRSYAPASRADDDLQLESALEAMENSISKSRKLGGRPTTSSTSSQGMNRSDATKGGKLQNASKQITSVAASSAGSGSALRSAKSLPDIHNNLAVQDPPPPGPSCDAAEEEFGDLSAYLPAGSPLRTSAPSPGRKKFMPSPRVPSPSGRRDAEESDNSLLYGNECRSPPAFVQDHTPGRTLGPRSSPMQRKPMISPAQIKQVAATEQRKPATSVSENHACVTSAASKELNAILQKRRRIVDQQCAEAEKKRPSPGRTPLAELDSNSGSPCEKRKSESEKVASVSMRADTEVPETCDALSGYIEACTDARSLPRPPVNSPNSPNDIRGVIDIRVQAQRRTRILYPALREALDDIVSHGEAELEESTEMELPEETKQPMETEADGQLEASPAQATTPCQTPSDKQSDCKSWSSGRVSLLSIEPDLEESEAPLPARQSPRRKLAFEEQEQSALQKMCQQLHLCSSAMQEKRQPSEDSSAKATVDEANAASFEAMACSPFVSKMKEKLSRHQILWTDKPVVGTDDHLSRAWSIEEFWFFEMRDRIPDDIRPIPEQLDEIPEHDPYDSREKRRQKDVRRTKSLSTLH